MSDEHSRLMAELQGAASEVLSCRIAGLESSEAEMQLATCMERIEAAEKDHQLQAHKIAAALGVVRYALESDRRGADVSIFPKEHARRARDGEAGRDRLEALDAGTAATNADQKQVDNVSVLARYLAAATAAVDTGLPLRGSGAFDIPREAPDA